MIASLAFAGGCQPAPQPSPPEDRTDAQQRLLDAINQTFAKAGTALNAGRTNEAVAFIEAAYTNDAFAANRMDSVDRVHPGRPCRRQAGHC